MPPDSNPRDRTGTKTSTLDEEDDALAECRERIGELDGDVEDLTDQLADHRTFPDWIHDLFRSVGTARRSSVVRIREDPDRSGPSDSRRRDDVFTGWVYDEDLVVSTRLAGDALDHPIVEGAAGTLGADPTVRTVDADPQAVAFFEVDTGDLDPLPRRSAASVSEGAPVLGIYYRMRGRYPGRVMHLGTFASGDDGRPTVEMTVQPGAPILDVYGTVFGMVGRDRHVSPPMDPAEWPLDRPDEVIQGFPNVNVEPVVPIGAIPEPEPASSDGCVRTGTRSVTDD